MIIEAEIYNAVQKIAKNKVIGLDQILNRILKNIID